MPFLLVVVDMVPAPVANPVVIETLAVPPVMTLPDPTYPDVKNPDDVPICMMTGELPFVETPENMIETRLAQLGITVKSTAVPDVAATAVAETGRAA